MSSVAILSAVEPVFASGKPEVLRARLESSLGENLSSTLLLRERVPPSTSAVGIAALDALTGGLPRGAMSELAGGTSSGRTGVMLSALAEASQRQEICALVDATDSFDPASASAAGVDLERLLWVRCRLSTCGQDRHKSVSRVEYRRGSFAFSDVLEQVLKVTDLVLHAGGFGMVILDLGDIPAESVRRIPLTSWFRFRRAVEPTATVLLLIEQEACAKTCASLVLHLQPVGIRKNTSDGDFVNGREHGPGPVSAPYVVSSSSLSNVQPILNGVASLPSIPANAGVSHADLLDGLTVRAEVIRSWKRKTPQSVHAQFNLSCQGESCG